MVHVYAKITECMYDMNSDLCSAPLLTCSWVLSASSEVMIMGRMCLLTLSTEVFFRRRSIFWRKIVGTLGRGRRGEVERGEVEGGEVEGGEVEGGGCDGRRDGRQAQV